MGAYEVNSDGARIMSRPPSPLPALLAVLCLAATALSAQEAGDRADRHPRAVTIGTHGLVERGQGLSGQEQWRGFPISLSLRDAPLPEVLRAFAQLAGFNLVLDPRIQQGTVTVELKDVPWDLALYVILKTHGLGAEVDGRLWLITSN
jgi:type IV pilus assembly protein PilQ